MNEYNSATNPVRDASEMEKALDNLVRRKLRVSDPRDPVLVARALLEHFPTEKTLQYWEDKGMPHWRMPLTATVPVAAGSSQAEVQQAITDVERDLNTLKTNSLLKDIEPELMGWDAAINAAMADGISAARQSLDPRQRDLAFANRRLLGDYARIARFVGALTPNMSIYYRRLAQSLDEVAAMVLVLMGEALASIGFAGGRFILQVAVGELQARRDAVIFALRNLVGSVQEGYGPQEWPRGMASYRRLLERFEDSGHSDLKALLQENNLARLMDDLIHRASGGTAEGMRQLGATSQLALEGLRRLVVFGKGDLGPASPPLTAFLSAVELFLYAFEHGARGNRLLFISRPPAVFYGLYGIGGPNPATHRLLELIVKRGKLAELLDCYLGCLCGRDQVRCQIILDKILYDVDRAIDLYSRGKDANCMGEPELRAAAYGYIIQAIFDANHTGSAGLGCFDLNQGNLPGQANTQRRECSEPADDYTLHDCLSEIQLLLCHQHYSVATYIKNSDSCIGFSGTLMTGKFFDSSQEKGFWELVNEFENCLVTPTMTHCPDDFKVVLKVREQMRHELCLQLTAEQRWLDLLSTMAPSCIRFNGEKLLPTTEIINAALALLYNKETACNELMASMPRTSEESLDNIYARLETGIQVECKSGQPCVARGTGQHDDAGRGADPAAHASTVRAQAEGGTPEAGQQAEGGASLEREVSDEEAAAEAETAPDASEVLEPAADAIPTAKDESGKGFTQGTKPDGGTSGGKKRSGRLTKDKK